MIRVYLIAFCLVVATIFAGCQKQNPSSAGKQPPVAVQVDDHDEHGPALELGTAPIGDRSVRAARDEGALSAGGEAAIDVWITGGTGNVSAVRFWIGGEDATGTIKALAAIEDSKDQTHWHAHVEVPSPLSDGSKLWVEVEDSPGAKNAASFDLNK